MIALLLVLAAAAPPRAAPARPAMIDGLPIAVLPPQTLPAEGCAAYLFSTGKTRALVAMVNPGGAAGGGTLRLALDGPPADYARVRQTGDAGYGFASVTEYRGAEVTATLDLAIRTRGDVTQGAIVEAATLRIDRPGKDTIVLPLGGLIGCAA